MILINGNKNQEIVFMIQSSNNLIMNFKSDYYLLININIKPTVTAILPIQKINIHFIISALALANASFVLAMSSFVAKISFLLSNSVLTSSFTKETNCSASRSPS